MQAEGGVPVSEFRREHGMSSARFNKWRAKFGGMDASLISKMKSMADENDRLKRIFAEMRMQNDLLKEALGKKREAISKTRDGHECNRATRCQYRVGLPYVSDQ